MRTEFQTRKGTVLPLMNLKGKEYLLVANRLVWFREECPDWRIETEPVSISDTAAIFKARILNSEGHVVATGHKCETAKGFPDFIEKAETGAVGRALAMVGYGTQFAPEMDEIDPPADGAGTGQRPVDAPQASKTSSPAVMPTQPRSVGAAAAKKHFPF